MLDNDEEALKPSRFYLRKGLSDLTSSALINLLDDEDSILRSCVAAQLHILGGTDEEFERIAVLGRDPRAYVREVAAYVLGQLGTPDKPYRQKSLPIISGLARDPDCEVRLAAIDALTHLNGTEAKSNVIILANDPSADVRRAVATYMSMLNESPDVLDILESLAKDEDPDVREAALLSIEDIQENGPPRNR